MICASLALLQIMFAVHRFAQGAEGKVLRIDRPLAGGFLSLTGLWPEGCGGGFAASFTKGGAASAAGCVEGLHRFAQGATAALPLRVVDCRFAVHSEHILHYANWICKGASATRKSSESVTAVVEGATVTHKS